MTKYIDTLTKLFYLLIFILSFYSTAFAIDLEYIFTIDNPSSRQANIKMTINNLSSDSLSVSSWTYSSNDPKIDILAIKITDINGNDLSFSAYPSNDPYEWTIDTTGLSQCVIEYTIEATPHRNYWEPTNENKYYNFYISEDFTMTPVWATFLLPIDESLPIGESWIEPEIIKISLNVPKDWQIITPWPWRNGFYFPLDIQYVHWYSYFRNTFIWFGHFDSYQKKIGDSDITVAFYGDLPADFKQDSVENIFDIYSYFSSVWGSSLVYPYFVLIYPISVNGDLVLGLEHELGQAISIETDPIQINWCDKAGEICETRWINYDWGFLGNESLWAKSGFCQLYAHKSMAKTRIYSREWVYGNFASAYDIYLQRIKDGEDLPLASDLADSDKPLSFSKGSLAVLLIAKEIYIRSGGTITFDDLNKQLFNKYWFKGRKIEEQELLSEINELTGTDFTTFFNDYIFGTELLQMHWMAEDDDGDGLSNLSEIFLDTNPEKIDTDGDGLIDDIEVAGCTDSNDPDSDDDGILDGTEDANHNGIKDSGETDPCNRDTDGDGMPDGWEIHYGLNPLVDDASEDADGDGYSNIEEYRGGSNPTDRNALPRQKAMPWIPLLLLDD